jgi:curved DNA-binding protein CbpA
MNNIDLALKTILSSSYINEYKIIDLNRLKKEYRKKAMQLHPDRARITGNSEESVSEQFKLLNNAYNLVSNIFKSKKYISIPYSKPYYRSHKKKAYTHSPYNFYNKKPRIIPKIKLRLCRYMYYKGLIDYRTIINAIIWQLQNRPKVGDIALKNNYITYEKIIEIIKNRKIGEKFCQAAVRLNFLQKHHVRYIFNIQKSYNKPIGQYFIEKKILTRNELNNILNELQNHNLKHTVT